MRRRVFLSALATTVAASTAGCSDDPNPDAGDNLSEEPSVESTPESDVPDSSTAEFEEMTVTHSQSVVLDAIRHVSDGEIKLAEPSSTWVLSSVSVQNLTGEPLPRPDVDELGFLTSEGVVDGSTSLPEEVSDPAAVEIIDDDADLYWFQPGWVGYQLDAEGRLRPGDDAACYLLADVDQVEPPVLDARGERLAPETVVSAEK